MLKFFKNLFFEYTINYKIVGLYKYKYWLISLKLIGPKSYLEFLKFT